MLYSLRDTNEIANDHTDDRRTDTSMTAISFRADLFRHEYRVAARNYSSPENTSRHYLIWLRSKFVNFPHRRSLRSRFHLRLSAVAKLFRAQGYSYYAPKRALRRPFRSVRFPRSGRDRLFVCQRTAISSPIHFGHGHGMIIIFINASRRGTTLPETYSHVNQW